MSECSKDGPSPQLVSATADLRVLQDAIRSSRYTRHELAAVARVSTNTIKRVLDEELPLFQADASRRERRAWGSSLHRLAAALTVEIPELLKAVGLGQASVPSTTRRAGADEQELTHVDAGEELASQVQRRLPGRPVTRNLATVSPLKIGICYEFLDTSWPLLAAKFTGSFAKTVSVPVKLEPMQWDDRCLEALRNEIFDVVLYNVECMRRFRDTTCARITSGDEWTPESGKFYVAFRLAPEHRKKIADSAKKARALIELLLAPETVKIIPPADMELGAETIARRFKMGRNHIDENRLFYAPGQGLESFLKPITAFKGRTVIFIGGQDQRAAIESDSQERTETWGPGELVILEQREILKELDIQLPASLSQNRLIVRGSQPPHYLEEIARAVREAERLIAEEGKWEEWKHEAILWYHLYNTRFASSEFAEARKGVSRHFESEIKRTAHLSPTLPVYFPKLAFEKQAAETQSRAS